MKLPTADGSDAASSPIKARQHEAYISPPSCIINEDKASLLALDTSKALWPPLAVEKTQKLHFFSQKKREKGNKTGSVEWRRFRREGLVVKIAKSAPLHGGLTKSDNLSWRP